MKADRAARLLHTPAQINVVACNAEQRIAASDLLQDIVSESHVATRDVFGHAVGKKNVDWSTWRVGNAISNQPVTGRCDVRTTDTSETIFLERVREILKPVWIRPRIVVCVGHDLASRRQHPRVARRAQA